jgi:hypothetical protein
MTPRDPLLRLAMGIIALWTLGCVIILVFAGGRMGEVPKPQPMRVGALCSPPTPALPASPTGACPGWANEGAGSGRPDPCRGGRERAP